MTKREADSSSHVVELRSVFDRTHTAEDRGRIFGGVNGKPKAREEAAWQLTGGKSLLPHTPATMTEQRRRIGTGQETHPDVMDYCLLPSYFVVQFISFVKSWLCCKFFAAVVIFDRNRMAGTVEAVLQIGAERQALLRQLHSALVAGNDAEALQIARRYCGLEGATNGQTDCRVD